MSKIEIVEPVLFAGVVADEIISTIEEAISERGSCSISLAGGSTPGAIYRMLAKPPRVENVDWSKVKLFWGDERWVSPDDVQSNFKMVHETLLSQLGSRQPQIFAVNTSLDTPLQAAKQYAEVIQKELPTEPRFDLMLLGIGEDGHTASLFPGAQVLRDKNPALCVATEHPEEKKPRISLSPRAILSSRRILFLVKGEAKADMVQRIIEGNEPVETLPACIYREAQDHVYFFLDSAAALKLKRQS